MSEQNTNEDTRGYTPGMWEGGGVSTKHECKHDMNCSVFGLGWSGKKNARR